MCLYSLCTRYPPTQVELSDREELRNLQANVVRTALDGAVAAHPDAAAMRVEEIGGAAAAREWAAARGKSIQFVGALHVGVRLVVLKEPLDIEDWDALGSFVLAFRTGAESAKIIFLCACGVSEPPRQ